MRVYVNWNRCKWWFCTSLLAFTSVDGYRKMVLVCFCFCFEMGTQFLWKLGLFAEWKEVSVQPAWMNFIRLHWLRLSPLRIWILLCSLWSSRQWNIRSQLISVRNAQKRTKPGPGWVFVCFFTKTHWWCQEVTVGERKLSPSLAPHIHHWPPPLPNYPSQSSVPAQPVTLQTFSPFVVHWIVSPPPKRHTEVLTLGTYQCDLIWK